MQPGVIIVSNRLPVSVKRVDGKLEFYPSVGGLATGLSSYANNRRNKWIGWPGMPSDDLSEADRVEITQELKKHNCYPVFLSQKQLDGFYNGFSNTILWPAFHELEFPGEAPDEQWAAYRKVNAQFAEAVLARSTRGSTIWIHDYQLLLLPSLIRAERPTDKIGFFLHIPFPRPDIFLQIPHAQQLLSGLIGADLLGFHTESYVQNFLDASARVGVGLIGSHKLILPDRVIRVTEFPMGIDYGKFARATRQRAARTELLRLRAKYGNKRIILTVDRLDPTKGLIERLQAYRQLLKQNPKLRGKVVMVMLAVPSRTEIAEYKTLKTKLEKLVKTVNKEFGTLRWQPVDYMYKSLPFHQLTALYRLADVAFIAPIKDGMNLVAKEYLATQPGSQGVLILSETAGAAEELKDAILVNPHETGSLVRGLTEALTTPQKQLRRQARNMQKHIENFTVQNWAGSFMRSLQRTKPEDHTVGSTRQLNDARQREIRTAYRNAKHRLLLLDYDGVLVPFHNKPSHAAPDKMLIRRLKRLSEKPSSHLAIISGRPREDLADWFGHLPNLTLIAEHGAFVRRRGTKRWQTAAGLDQGWKEEIKELLEYYTAKTPGASIEEKAASLVWHYRRANPYYAHKHLVILKKLLGKLARDHAIQVEQGNMILEVRPSEVHKGTASIEHVAERTDFVLAIGDDATDEDMFRQLPDWAYTIKVGRGRTAARYRAKNVDTVLGLLKLLAK